MTELASRTLLLGEPKRRYAEVDVDGFGRIRMQSLSAKEAELLSCVGADGFDAKQFAARKPIVIGMCLVDKENQRLFGEADIATIASQDAATIDKIYEACEQHLNGDVVTAKNLSETKTDVSQYDSPTNSDGPAVSTISSNNSRRQTGTRDALPT